MANKLSERTQGTGASAAISGWESYTPSLNGLPAPVNVDFQYRRVGDTLEVEGQFTTGGIAPTADEFRISLPPGLTSAAPVASPPRFRCGEMLQDVVDVQLTYALLNADGFGYVRVGRTVNDSSVNPTTPLSASSFLLTNQRYTLQFKVPIAEWAGSGTVNLGAGQVEYASNSDPADAPDTISFAYGPQGSEVPTITASTGGASSTTKRVRFQTPIQATDIIELQVDRAGEGRWFPIGSINSYDAYQQQNTEFYGIGIKRVSGSNTDIDVDFGRAGCRSSGASFGAVGSNYPDTVGDRWRVVKHSAGVPVGFGLADKDNAGLAKKNRIQKKEDTRASIASVSDAFTFSGLTTGKIYRLSCHFTSSTTAGIDLCENGVCRTTLYSPTGNHTYSGQVVFVATGTTAEVKVISGTLTRVGGFNQAILEEMNNWEETTDFT